MSHTKIHLIDPKGEVIAKYLDVRANVARQHALERIGMGLPTRQVIIRPTGTRNTYEYVNGQWVCQNPA